MAGVFVLVHVLIVGSLWFGFREFCTIGALLMVWLGAVLFSDLTYPLDGYRDSN